MATKKGLGKGLEALLGPKVEDIAAVAGQGISQIKLDQLIAGKYQPRQQIDEGSLYELAESIKAQGVMQPIIVRLVADKKAGVECYEIIAGERRTRAAKLAGLSEIPAIVRDVSDKAAAAMALIENMQREDLNPLEEAHGLQRLINEFGLSHEEAAKAVGRSRSAASNILRLLNLSTAVQTMLRAGDIDMGHARALLALERAQQVTTANEIISKKLSVRQAESLVKRVLQDAHKVPKGQKTTGKSADIRHLETELSDVLAAPVEINIKKRTKRGDQGELVIGFGSLDELDGILQKIKNK
ncbi:MAG: ParB/RepB/Spo0J family partition protein [Saezia sp.]